MSSPQRGRCLCGQVQFQVDGEPVTSRLCWCRDCQRVASNGTTNAIFPKAALQVQGHTAVYSRTADSGNTVHMRFCPQCGTQLFADSSARPGLTVVRLGTLDDPSAIRPGANIWADSAPAWACLDPALDRVARQPGAPPAPPVPPT